MPQFSFSFLLKYCRRQILPPSIVPTFKFTNFKEKYYVKCSTLKDSNFEKHGSFKQRPSQYQHALVKFHFIYKKQILASLFYCSQSNVKNMSIDWYNKKHQNKKGNHHYYTFSMYFIRTKIKCLYSVLSLFSDSSVYFYGPEIRRQINSVHLH